MINYKERYDALVEEGWLISQVHPTLDLTIYNYSQKTQYERYWNDDTLAARGLVLNSEGTIVARPFPKFFNAEEVPDQIPSGPFEVYEKLDGSLGIFFLYAGSAVFASRGSFTSEQATRGWEMMKRLQWDAFSPGITYMFEIIYPENRIVVDYAGVEKLVLLGAINTKSGREVPRCVLEEHYESYFELVKGYNITESWEHLKSQNEPNREGYVLLYPNGFRVKVKFEEYKRLHHIITGVSNVNIWECLRDNYSMEKFLENFPDEFYQWVRKVETELREKHANILWDAHEVFDRLTKRLGAVERKEYAFALADEPLKSLVYRFLDGRTADDIAWKMVKPKWSKPFFQVAENC